METPFCVCDCTRSNAYIFCFRVRSRVNTYNRAPWSAPQYPHFLTGYPKTTLPFDSCLLGLITRQSSFSFSRYSFDFREAHSKHSYQMFPLGDSNMCVAALEQSKSAQVESIRTLGRFQSIFNMWLDNLSYGDPMDVCSTPTDHSFSEGFIGIKHKAKPITYSINIQSELSGPPLMIQVRYRNFCNSCQHAAPCNSNSHPGL